MFKTCLQFNIFLWIVINKLKNKFIINLIFIHQIWIYHPIINLLLIYLISFSYDNMLYSIKMILLSSLFSHWKLTFSNMKSWSSLQFHWSHFFVLSSHFIVFISISLAIHHILSFPASSIRSIDNISSSKSKSYSFELTSQ